MTNTSFVLSREEKSPADAAIFPVNLADYMKPVPTQVLDSATATAQISFDVNRYEQVFQLQANDAEARLIVKDNLGKVRVLYSAPIKGTQDQARIIVEDADALISTNDLILAPSVDVANKLVLISVTGGIAGKTYLIDIVINLLTPSESIHRYLILDVKKTDAQN